MGLTKLYFDEENKNENNMLKNIVIKHIDALTNVKVQELLNINEHTFENIKNTIENIELHYFHSKSIYFQMLFEKYYEKSINNLTFNNIYVLNILYNKYLDREYSDKISNSTKIPSSKIPALFIKELKYI